jgi:hypothetical protein
MPRGLKSRTSSRLRRAAYVRNGEKADISIVTEAGALRWSPRLARVLFLSVLTHAVPLCD